MNEKTLPNGRPVPAVIVSRPGIMAQSLRASLAACPAIVVVASFGDGLTALNYVSAHAPALLVIDSNLLDQEVEALLAAVKAKPLATRCLVFTRSSGREAWAWASGADAVMPRDGSLKDLMNVLSRFQDSR
jgi:DNA-binding NarL/FixJ family response regulator